MLLGGDLGGTKTLLALAEPAEGRLRVVHQRRYASAAYPTFEALLGDFLGDAPVRPAAIAAACFGVAGPTDGRHAQLTYLPWQLAAAALKRRFALGRVTLINDFAAAAHGLPAVDDSETLSLRTGQPVARAPRIVLGAGTGLGVAGLIWQSGRYRVIPGEGGHIGFSPQTPEQGDLWRWLLARMGRVTTEDIVSGPGLARIFAFLTERAALAGNASLAAGPGSRPAAEIGAAALAGSDPLAVAALRLWLACYGAFAGDLALQWLARGGVYLAGGIAAKLLPNTDPAPFIDAFLAKRGHRALVDDMPVRLLTAEDLGLRGALACAAQQDRRR